MDPLSHIEFEPLCPLGHPLRLKDHEELGNLEWICDGAILSHHCLANDDNDSSSSINNNDNRSGQTEENRVLDDTTHAAASSIQVGHTGSRLRFRCEENCNFDLCQTCYQFLRENGGDKNVDDTSKAITGVILAMRKTC